MSSTRSGLSNRILGAGLLGAETSREGDRATTLELFFDLVYAFAFTQVTALMVHHQTVGGVLQGLVILLLLWGPWASFALLAIVFASRSISCVMKSSFRPACSPVRQACSNASRWLLSR